MAHLIRPTYTDRKTGKSKRTAKWYGVYKDTDGVKQRVPLSANKAAAQTMLNELVRASELGKVGIRDPFAEHRAKPLTGHLADYREHHLGPRDHCPTGRPSSGPVPGRVRGVPVRPAAGPGRGSRRPTPGRPAGTGEEGRRDWAADIESLPRRREVVWELARQGPPGRREPVPSRLPGQRPCRRAAQTPGDDRRGVRGPDHRLGREAVPPDRRPGPGNALHRRRVHRAQGVRVGEPHPRIVRPGRHPADADRRGRILESTAARTSFPSTRGWRIN